jgi:hypothetical protein
MAKNRNNESSRNWSSGDQPLMSGWRDTARERPLTTAAAVGGAIAAGVFLWSRRNQISDQLSHMSDQISEWSENMRSQQGQSSSPSLQTGGRSSTPMGTETGQPQMAGAGTRSARGSTRATGGRSGKAQTGSSMSPSRDTTEGVTM